MKIIRNPAPYTWDNLIRRPALETRLLDKTVRSILEDVKKNGDRAIIQYNRKFSGVDLEYFSVSREEVNRAADQIDTELKSAIHIAAKNIEAFHRSQLIPEKKVETTSGVLCWRKQVAIEKVGLYIPGGSAPLFSTLLMLAIPAKIAGCAQIILCSPPGKNGGLDAAILYSAQFLGVEQIYKIGGAQSIAAMAYGTETVPAVNKVFGPGNQYVTLAKQMVNLSGTAIDLPAGPSEVAVIADKSASASFIAADLIAQAEHGLDSQVLLLTDHEPLIKNVQSEIEKQMADLPRAAIAEKSLMNSKLILFKNIAEAVTFSNHFAPEHLIVMTRNTDLIISEITNAGSVFIGEWTPEAAGDYASGTNHTLPTGGFARSYSGVSLDSFYKNITFQKLSPAGIQNIGPVISTMAEAEQLAGHANSVNIRLKALSRRNQ